MKSKLIILIVFSCFRVLCFANNIIDDPEKLYQAPTNNILSTKISVKRTFNSIYDLLDMLNLSEGVSTKLVSVSSEKATSIKVVLDNASLEDLLNICAAKLGYNWELNTNTVLFKAISPKIAAVPTQITKSTVLVEPSWLLEQKDRTLRNSLTKWCSISGWHLIWRVGADYPIVVPWSIKGTFESAVNQVLLSSQSTDMPLQAIMHDSNKVLEIFSLSSSNKYANK